MASKSEGINAHPSRNGKARSDTSGADAAEKAVLATVLRAGRIVDSAAVLTAEDFRVFAHRVIWKAIKNLSEQGKPTHTVNVAHFLETEKQIGHRRFCPDVSYSDLLELQELAFIPEGLFEYVTIVRENSGKRGLRLVAEEIWTIAQSSAPYGQSLEEIRQELGKLVDSPATWTPTSMNEVDASELASSVKAHHLDFLPLLGQDGYLVKGWSHLLSGYPRSGKTELLAACCCEWLRMGESILYFTEEPQTIWEIRLSKSPGPWSGMRLVFALGADPLAIRNRMQFGHESVVVVDSIRNLGLVGQDETDNTALAAAITPWVITAREKNKTLALTHHNRKGGGQHGEAIAGGHALLGTVDIALEIFHDNCPTRRQVRAYARILQPPEMMYERRDDGTLHALGSPDSVNLEEVRRRVIDAVEGEWLKTAEVWERLGDPKPSTNVVRQALLAEAEAGAIERDPAVTEGKVERKTHRWRKTAWA